MALLQKIHPSKMSFYLTECTPSSCPCSKGHCLYWDIRLQQCSHCPELFIIEVGWPLNKHGNGLILMMKLRINVNSVLSSVPVKYKSQDNWIDFKGLNHLFSYLRFVLFIYLFYLFIFIFCIIQSPQKIFFNDLLRKHNSIIYFAQRLTYIYI